MAKKSKQYDYDLSEVKRLISDTDKNYREISAETGCPYASVVYHGRKIRGRVNRINNQIVTQLHKQAEFPPEQPTETPTPLAGTTFTISRNDISIHEAELEASRMIKAAKTLGLNKVNITIEK